MQVNKSDFSRFRLGYIDGYAGRDPTMPRDSVYMRGYDEGSEDDSMGSISRFPDDEQSV